MLPCETTHTSTLNPPKSDSEKKSLIRTLAACYPSHV